MRLLLDFVHCWWGALCKYNALFSPSSTCLYVLFKGYLGTTALRANSSNFKFKCEAGLRKQY